MTSLYYYWEGELEPFASNAVDVPDLAPQVGDLVLLAEDNPDYSETIAEAIVISRRPRLSLNWVMTDTRDTNRPAVARVSGSETGVAIFLQRLKKE